MIWKLYNCNATEFKLYFEEGYIFRIITICQVIQKFCSLKTKKYLKFQF